MPDSTSTHEPTPSTPVKGEPTKNRRRWLRFSLRSWLCLLTLICIGVGVRQYVNKRKALQEEIINTATLIYDGSRRHAKSIQYESSAMGQWTDGPAPYIGLRDSKWAPWLSQWSKGSLVFCPFDSIQSHSSSPPQWINQVMSSGEPLRVTLSNLDEKEIDLALLMHCTNLESLDLSGTSYQPDALAGIHRLKRLEKLSIHRMKLSLEATLPRGLPPGLVELRLVANELSPEGLAALVPCEKLESLEIASNPVSLHAVTQLPKSLKQLRLRGTKVNVLDLDKVRLCEDLEWLDLTETSMDLRQCPSDLLPASLKKLELTKAELDKSSWEMLAELKNLEELTLDGCEFDDADAEGVKLSANLRVFSARNTKANRNVAAALAPATGAVTINFAGSQVDDRAVANLGTKPELKVLLLGDTQVTDAAGDWLADAASLHRLELYNTQISDHLFKVAPNLKQVDDLRVHDTQVSATVTNELRAIQQARWKAQSKSRSW